MRVFICDDQAIVRDRLERFLKLEKDMAVMGGAGWGGGGGTGCPNLARPGSDGLKNTWYERVEAMRRICAITRKIRILVLTTFDDAWVFDAVRAGTAGSLLKDTPYRKVMEANRDTAPRPPSWPSGMGWIKQALDPWI